MGLPKELERVQKGQGRSTSLLHRDVSGFVRLRLRLLHRPSPEQPV